MNKKTEKICPSCGNFVDGDFCTECGEVFEDGPMTVTLTGEEIAAICYAYARLRMRLNSRHTSNAYTKTLGILVDRLEKNAKQ